MRNPVRMLAAITLATLAGLSLTSCQHMRGYESVLKRDAGNFWATTERMFLADFDGGIKRACQSFDRFVVNYDWDDPTLD